MVFHLNKPGFTRALLKNSKQALQILSPEATKKTEGQESSPFLEDDREAPVSPDDPKITFIVPEDRFNVKFLVVLLIICCKFDHLFLVKREEYKCIIIGNLQSGICSFNLLLCN